MYLWVGFIVPGILEDCFFFSSKLSMRFERILVFYCKDTQVVELRVPVALAAWNSRAPVYRTFVPECVVLSNHAWYYNRGPILFDMHNIYFVRKRIGAAFITIENNCSNHGHSCQNWFHKRYLIHQPTTFANITFSKPRQTKKEFWMCT